MDFKRRVEHRGGRTYRLVESVGLALRGGNGVLHIAVPAGFELDVSVPWYLRWLFDPHDDRFLKAAALHDYALHVLVWPREVAAAPFGHSLRENGVSSIKRLAMVLAVIIWRWE